MQLAYINTSAIEIAKNPSAEITLSQIISQNSELTRDGSVVEIQTEQGSYGITSIKVNDVNIGETVTIPNNGSVTLQVTIGETTGDNSKYYGVLEGKYYEIELINEQIVIDNQAKTLQEIQGNSTNVQTPTFTATWNNQTGDNTNVDNLSVSVDTTNNKKDVIITDNGAQAGTRTVKISYGENVTRNVKVNVPYVITYDQNYGDGGTTTQSKIGNSSVTLKGSDAFTREGWEITKWNTQADGNGTDYALGATYSANSNLTLYAVWTFQAPEWEFVCNLPQPAEDYRFEVDLISDNRRFYAIDVQTSDLYPGPGRFDGS